MFYTIRGGLIMNADNMKNTTWHDVLIKNGFDSSSSKSLIGFISWNKGDEFPKLGTEITEVLSDYEGRVFAKDAINKVYGDKALLFFDRDISQDTANKMFDVIMGYEQNEVYNTLEIDPEIQNSIITMSKYLK